MVKPGKMCSISDLWKDLRHLLSPLRRPVSDDWAKETNETSRGVSQQVVGDYFTSRKAEKKTKTNKHGETKGDDQRWYKPKMPNNQMTKNRIDRNLK